MRRLGRSLVRAGVVLSLLLFAGTVTLWVRGYRLPPGKTPPLPSRAPLQVELARPIPYVTLHQNDLGDVVDFLVDISGANIVVDWPALQEVGVTKETKVSREATRERLGELLTHLLPANRGLRFIAEDNILFISTDAGLARNHHPSWPPSNWPPSAVAQMKAMVYPYPERVIAHRRWTLAWDRGTVHLWVMPADPAAVYQDGSSVGVAKKWNEEAVFQFAGVTLQRARSPFNTWALGIRCWMLAILTAISPAVWLIRAVRRGRQVTSGECPTCGYDLRATPQRCPECGTVLAIKV